MVTVTVAAVMFVADSAGVWMFDVAVMVAAMIFVALKAGVWIFEVAVTVAPVRFVAETVPAIPKRLPEASRYTDLPAGYAQKTTLVPAARVTTDPLLDDAKIVSRESKVPDAV